MKSLPIVIILVCLAIPFIYNDINTLNYESKSINSVSDRSASSSLDTTSCMFYENLGQIKNNDIRYYGCIPGGLIGFGLSKVYLTTNEGEGSIVQSFFDSTEVTPMGEKMGPCHSNFYLGERGTYTNVRSFSQVRYDNLWTGISLIYTATPQGAKYEFTVSPRNDVSLIRMHYENFKNIRIKEDSIDVLVNDYCFTDEGLVAYQDEAEIQVKFVEYEDNIYGFDVEGYNPSSELVIDPLLYATYLGGIQADTGSSVAVDSLGNMYVGGTTYSANFPTENAYNDTLLGETDCYITKFNPDGELVYSTFFGGSRSTVPGGVGSEELESIAVDSEGNVYATGNTRSTDYPTTENAYYRTETSTAYGNDEGDCFFFKLDSEGDLLYSTYYGGNSGERGRAIAVDSSGYAYIAGWTTSDLFPLYNAIDSTISGREAFVLKIDAEGSDPDFCTYFGGPAIDYATGIAVDDLGQIYVTGYTLSETEIESGVNPYQTENKGDYDCFILKLSNVGSDIFCTYLGGNDTDQAFSIAVDSEGNSYVTGRTQSSDFPTMNPYDDSLDGQDAFVAKLTPDGSDLVFSTFVGGAETDRGSSIQVDEDSNVYITGPTSSRNLYTSDYSEERENPGSTSVFLMKLDSDGSSPLYSTYYGGTEQDISNGLALLESETSVNAYVVGETRSEDFTVHEDAYQNTAHGDFDAFLICIEIQDSPYQTPTGPGDDPTIIYIGASIGTVVAVGFTVALARFIRKAKEIEADDLYQIAMRAEMEDED